MAWLIEQKRKRGATGRKEPYWQIGWRDETGKIRTRAIGFCTTPEANKALKVFEGKQAAGEKADPAATTPTPTANGSSPAAAATAATPAVPTVADYLRKVYLPVVERDKSKKTASSAKTCANALITILGDLALPEVNYAVVDAYLSERRNLGRRSQTLILELHCLRGALRHASDCGVIAIVPKLPTVRNVDKRPHKFLTAEQSVVLLDALRPLDEQPHTVTRGKPPIRRDRLTYLAVLVALNTGMRKGEILSRTWEDVRWSIGPHGTLFVSAKEEIGFQVKTRRGRAIPLTPELRAEFEAAYREAGSPSTGWIFPAPHDPSKPRATFGHALREACRRSGLPHIHPHGLRHTWASRLAMSGVDRKTLMEVGGWQEGRMLDEIYAHVTDAHVVEVMGRMGLASSRALSTASKTPEHDQR